VYGNLITNFPSSVSGQATIKCDDANYWVSETACIQRENYTNVWSNVACASNSGWGITTISMTHFCSYTTYLDYWRMQVIGQVSGIGGSFGGSATSPVDSGHCA
jgi:hypothetical protein